MRWSRGAGSRLAYTILDPEEKKSGNLVTLSFRRYIYGPKSAMQGGEPLYGRRMPKQMCCCNNIAHSLRPDALQSN